MYINKTAVMRVEETSTNAQCTSGNKRISSV